MRIVIASAVVLRLVNSASPVWPADAATPLVVEARIKEGPKRRFQTRIVDHLDRFDASSREPLDVYRGWKTKRYEATGFFYPKKIGDRWWLIDPQGYRFLHVAVNSVSPGDSPTNRETLPQRFGSLERWRDEMPEVAASGKDMPLFAYMYSNGYLGMAHLLRLCQQDKDSPNPGSPRGRQGSDCNCDGVHAAKIRPKTKDKNVEMSAVRGYNHNWRRKIGCPKRCASQGPIDYRQDRSGHIH